MEKGQVVVVVVSGVFVRQHDVPFQAGVVMHSFRQSTCAEGKKSSSGDNCQKCNHCQK